MLMTTRETTRKVDVERMSELMQMEYGDTVYISPFAITREGPNGFSFGDLQRTDSGTVRIYTASESVAKLMAASVGDIVAFIAPLARQGVKEKK